MEKTEYGWKKMSDSLIVPALTIHIPMPKGVAVPQSERRNSVVQSIAASGEDLHDSEDE